MHGGYRLVGPDAAGDPYFFLSYAHTPRHDHGGDSVDPDIWVAALFRDLCEHIMHFSNLPNGARPGFMDRDLQPGEEWPARLSHALATCRVFVPLYSRRYFESEHCGKEWHAFHRRELNHRARNGQRVQAIVPAIWVPVESRLLPDVASSIQFDHESLGADYAEHGFYGIIKLSRFRQAYEVATYELARRIMEVAQQSVMEPDTDSDYESEPCAFGRQVPSMSGGQRVRLTIVAPSRDSLPPGRGGYHYGAGARDWNPYRPDSKLTLAAHAAYLVRSLGYRPEIGDLAEHQEELLGGDPPSGPQVLIVDPWAATQPDCQAVLRRFDALDKPWVQVIVPRNREDTGNADADKRLHVAIDTSLHRKLAEGRVTSRVAVLGVPSLEAFSQTLPAVIMTAVRQYLKHAAAFPPSGPPVERPRLSGPPADPSIMEQPNE